MASTSTITTQHESNVSISKSLSSTPKSCRSNQESLSLVLDFSKKSFDSAASKTHPHILFSPIHYEPGYSYPLLVWLHDTGDDERQVTRVMPQISMRNYVAVAPQGFAIKKEAEDISQKEDTDWDAFDVKTIIQRGVRSKPTYSWSGQKKMLSEIEQRVFDSISVAVKTNNIAENRVFIAGFGAGGRMALQLGLLYPEYFAGVASIDGAFPKSDEMLYRWNAARSLPVFLTFGQKSHMFSSKSLQQTLELFHSAGLPLTVREYEGGHDLTPTCLQDMNRWIMNIVCS
ncbi:MAG: alpha/beta hydrolase [Thermoguttaceae bacterium]